MRRKYGEVAIEATKYIQATREDPEKAWNKFAEEIFGTGSSGAKKKLSAQRISWFMCRRIGC